MKILLVDVKLFLFLTLLSLFFLLLDTFGFLNFPKATLQNITIPILYGLYNSNKLIMKQLEFVSVAKKDFLENKALKIQMAEILTENAILQKKLQEIESLVDQYNKLNPETFDLLPARVIGLERYLTIDRGSLDGAEEDQVAVFKDNYLGRVKNVTPHTSQIILATDPSSKVAVFSQGSDGRAKGVVSGQFGSELLMDKILHEETVSVGDLVYSEGTEGKLPKGLIIGKISEVMERQNEFFKQAKVEPIYKAVDLDVVFVISNP